MTEYTRDGGVISSGMPRSTRTVKDHTSKFGVYRGVILETIFPTDPRNTSPTGGHIEYIVKIKGQAYRGVRDLRKSGARWDYHERTRKRSLLASAKTPTTDDMLADGEHVFVMFLEGHNDSPLIIGAADHPLRPSLATLKDLNFDKEVFNGIEVTITGRGDFLIRQDGLHDDTAVGAILNPTAINSRIYLNGTTGDIELSTNAPPLSETPDLSKLDVRIKLDKTLKQLELYAQQNEVILSATGMKITDLNQNVIETNATAVSIKAGATAEIKVENTGKFKLTNGTDNLIDLLSQVTDLLAQTNQALATAVTATILGPIPLSSAGLHATINSTVTTIKAKIEAMKSI